MDKQEYDAITAELWKICISAQTLSAQGARHASLKAARAALLKPLGSLGRPAGTKLWPGKAACETVP
jgi:hypothetical protein